MNLKKGLENKEENIVVPVIFAYKYCYFSKGTMSPRCPPPSSLTTPLLLLGYIVAVFL